MLSQHKKYPKNIINIKERYKFKNEFTIFKNKDKLVLELFTQLNLMLNSNITLTQSIELLLKSKQDNEIKSILLKIDEAIKTAIPIDIALVEHKKFLGETAILFLKLGIENGNIKESVDSLVELLNQNNINKNRFKDTLRYPLILIASLFVAIFMIFIYVIPNFKYIFKMLDGQLPLATKVLIQLDYIFQNYTILIFGGLFLVGVIIYKLYLMQKQQFDKLLILKIPIVSKLVKNYLFFKLFLSISIIVKSKFQFQTAIEHSKDIIENSYIKDIIKDILKQIKNGTSVATGFENSKLFDDVTIRLLHIAEQTNNYTEVLNDITNYHKQSFEKSIKNFSSVIEPVIVFIISLIVLWLILAVMMPIWNLSSSLQ